MSAMGRIIWIWGFSWLANWRNFCTARSCSMWYRLFIATLSFFLAENDPRPIMTESEGRYFLRTNGHPPRGVGHGLVYLGFLIWTLVSCRIPLSGPRLNEFATPGGSSEMVGFRRLV